MSTELAEEVDRRLGQKDKMDIRMDKMRIRNDGTKAIGDYNVQYYENHDVISKQIKREDPEETFSFNPPLWRQRISQIAKIISQYKVTTVNNNSKNQIFSIFLSFYFQKTKIIDFGCGNGKFINYLRNSQIEEREFYGIDIDLHELSCAIDFCSPIPADYLNKRPKKFNVNLYHGSILEPESFLRDKDCLLCIEV